MKTYFVEGLKDTKPENNSEEDATKSATNDNDSETNKSSPDSADSPQNGQSTKPLLGSNGTGEEGAANDPVGGEGEKKDEQPSDHVLEVIIY